MQKNKFLKKCIILIILFISVVTFVYNDYFIYQRPILKITNISEEYIREEQNLYGYKEKIYNQKITGIIKNTKLKNMTVELENGYYEGQTYSQKYHINDEVFININQQDNEIIKARIEEYKRDKYIAILIGIFTISIILVGQKKGLLSLLSVISNIVIFIILTKLNYLKVATLSTLTFLGAIIFSVLCLLLVSGKNKKTLSAIISTIISIILVTIISIIVIKLTKYEGIRFERMDLVTRSIEGIFISEIIIGGLGAIMDISISMSSSLNELIERNSKIKNEQLIKSGFNIGKDIMSTMINVLFFTYICTIIPNVAIYLRNGLKLGALLEEYISFEMTRALTGAIGITIAIPISIYTTLFIYKRRKCK